MTQFENWKCRERKSRENGSGGDCVSHISHVGAKVKSETERSSIKRKRCVRDATRLAVWFCKTKVGGGVL